MKRLFLVLLSVSAALSGARASGIFDHVLPRGEWEYSVSTFAMSEYFGSIVGGTFYPGPMTFTDVIAKRNTLIGTTRIDFSAGQKLNRIRSYNFDGGNEYDFTLGHTFKLEEDPPVLVDVSVCYLAVTNLRRMKNDVISSQMRLDFPHVPEVQPYIVAYRFDVLNRMGSGWFIYGGVIRNQKTAIMALGKPLVIQLETRSGYSGGGLFGRSSGLSYHRLTISPQLTIGNWSVTPSVIGQIIGNGQDAGRAFVTRPKLMASLAASRPL